MFCKNCGKEIENVSTFCPYCGIRVRETEQSPYQNFNYDDDNGDFATGDDYFAPGERNIYIGNSVNVERRERRNRSREKLSYFNFSKYILLSIITLGIYSIVTLFRFNKTVNTLCEGDGQETPNYIVVILLGMVTFGIYSNYWIYKQAKRLHEIAPKYQCKIEETGNSVLAWSTFGLLILVGPWIAWRKMFANINLLIKRYNRGQINEQYIARGSQKNGKAIGILVGFYFLQIVVLIIVIALLMGALFLIEPMEWDVPQTEIMSETTSEIVPEKITEASRQITEVAEATEEKSTNKEEIGKTVAEEVDYARIYDEAVNQLAERIESMSWMSLSSMSYIFYDLNRDGYLELLLEEPVGRYKAYTIYTTDGENCIKLSDTGYLVNMYEAVDQGIVTYLLDNQNTQTITRFTIENGALVKTDLYTGARNEDVLYGMVGKELFASHKVTDGLMWGDEAENNEMGNNVVGTNDYIFPNSDT